MSCSALCIEYPGIYVSNQTSKLLSSTSLISNNLFNILPISFWSVNLYKNRHSQNRSGNSQWHSKCKSDQGFTLRQRIKRLSLQTSDGLEQLLGVRQMLGPCGSCNSESETDARSSTLNNGSVICPLPLLPQLL